MKGKYNTGLVLSGGGTRGFAHPGVIAALYEKGIKPDVISGVSAGSIAGAFIAAGKSPEEILEIFKKGSFFKYTKINLPVNGLLKLDGLKEVIKKEISVTRIEELSIPFIVCVANLTKGVIEYKETGLLGETVLASSSIPVLFAPVEIENNLYVDGGVLDNIPITPIKNKCERIIVSNISPLSLDGKVKNLIQIAARTVYMSVNANIKDVHKHASVFIEPEGIDKYDFMLRSNADELFELGYNSTKKEISKKL